ncbi:MAG TPA: guanylate kinase [Candidatus Deferrimicrobiaceae bacterium]|nr:guanylate kinase [Candidatus Deferrimicrobiaceae bacterium]
MKAERTVAGAPGALLVIVSGPSGVGKDTVINALRSIPSDPPRHFVVTCTTRPRRAYERDGVHYHFLSRAAFLERRGAGELLEANEVHGHWYGTPRDEVRQALRDGHDVVLKIDVQGAAVVKQKVSDALLVFLVPPSLEDLFSRLQARATESADELDVRQRNAALELARQKDYDHVVLNETGEIERTAARVDAIIRAEKAANPDRRTRV